MEGPPLPDEKQMEDLQAYFRWGSENRASILAEHPLATFREFGELAKRKWNSMPKLRTT